MIRRTAWTTWTPGITWRGSRDGAAEAVDALRVGRLHGKAVLIFDA
ncbi:hypothetical protein [Kitasatospora sp. HPMI-4]